VKLGKNASDSSAVHSEAYKVEIIKNSSVFGWHTQFKEGHKTVEDDERCGHPRSHRMNENVEKVWNLVYTYRCSQVSQL
jgi:hypothetical protein